MLDDWFRRLTLNVSEADFRRLPRHVAYRYEYRQGQTVISPRPHVYHALLDIAPRPIPQQIHIPDRTVTLRLRTLEDRDWTSLVPIFAAAMANSAPVQTLTPEERLECAKASLLRTRAGQDGPIITSACLVAAGADDIPQAGLLMTLIHRGDMETYDDPDWEKDPPDNALEQRWGRPHLTWILVDPPLRRRGVGEALLCCALNRLHELGYQDLASSFLLGNESSMLWHWKMGFRLLSHVLAPRRLFNEPEHRR